MEYEKYMTVALRQAERALDTGEFPVGCVIVLNDEIVATGQRKNSSMNSVNEIDHAEIVALREFSRVEAAEKDEAVLYCTLEPCLMCYAAIILSGIKKIVFAFEDAMGGGTSCDLSELPPLYSTAEIKVIPEVLRSESLKLFNMFFENPENNYWRGSFLEEYTLLAFQKEN